MANVTIYDVAKKCGVSPGTVSKAINNYSAIPSKTKERILKAMKEMNYIPNVGAKALSKRVSKNIGVLAYFGMDISPFKSPLFTEILDSAQSDLNSQGYDLLFVSHNVDGRDGSFYENCVSRNVAGTLLFGDMSNPKMKEVTESSIPCVAFDYADDNVTGVFSNNKEAMKELTRYLISLGHKRIVFVHGEQSRATDKRIEGFKEAMNEAGIALRDDTLVPARYLDVDSVANITRNLMRRILPPTAILYPDDRSAIRALSTLQSLGLTCPGDVSIAGFDGLEISQIVSPHLTTVKQDTAKIGKILAKELIDLIEKKKTTNEIIEARASLLIGESTSSI